MGTGFGALQTCTLQWLASYLLCGVHRLSSLSARAQQYSAGRWHRCGPLARQVAAGETSYLCRQTFDIFDLQSYIVREDNDLLEFKAEHMQLCGTVLLAVNNQRA